MSIDPARHQQHQDALVEALGRGAYNEARHLLNSLSAPDAAHLLETSPPRQRETLWQLLHPGNEARLLQYLDEEVRSSLLKSLSSDELIALLEDLATDDLADLLRQLPEWVTTEVMTSLDQQNRTRLEAVLSYDGDTAGGLMDLDIISVRPEITLATVQRFLRRRGELPSMTDQLAVVNRTNEFVGMLALNRLLVLDPTTTVREAMRTDEKPIPADLSARDVSRIFERRDLISAPVVDDQMRLLGRITIDDVVDVIRDDTDHSMMSMAGLDEAEDTFGPIWTTLRQRSVWLGVNLLTALAASAVINLFQETINQMVALAVLMPIVASMGGIAGSQTLTLVVRAMALGQIQDNNARYLLGKELAVGALNGLTWAAVVGITAGLWFHDPRIGGIIAAAMLINLTLAALAGALLPMTLKRMGIDPALAGTVILTTITDIVGFLAFLGLATLLLQTLL